jgi:hypothetical protein
MKDLRDSGVRRDCCYDPTANWRVIAERARKEEELMLPVAQFCRALPQTEIVRNIGNPAEREEFARLLQIGLKAGRIRP